MLLSFFKGSVNNTALTQWCRIFGHNIHVKFPSARTVFKLQVYVCTMFLIVIFNASKVKILFMIISIRPGFGFAMFLTLDCVDALLVGAVESSCLDYSSAEMFKSSVIVLAVAWLCCDCPLYLYHTRMIGLFRNLA